jgi:hypothetical protein
LSVAVCAGLTALVMPQGASMMPADAARAPPARLPTLAPLEISGGTLVRSSSSGVPGGCLPFAASLGLFVLCADTSMPCDH